MKLWMAWLLTDHRTRDQAVRTCHGQQAFRLQLRAPRAGSGKQLSEVAPRPRLPHRQRCSIDVQPLPPIWARLSVPSPHRQPSRPTCNPHHQAMKFADHRTETQLGYAGTWLSRSIQVVQVPALADQNLVASIDGLGRHVFIEPDLDDGLLWHVAAVLETLLPENRLLSEALGVCDHALHKVSEDSFWWPSLKP